MLEELERLDQKLFLQLNGLHQDWLDPIMIALSEPIYSAPIFIFIFYHLKSKYGMRVAIYSLFGLALVITLCDGISDKIFKDGFQRWRPCKNLLVGPQTYLPQPCPGGWYSFVSGHATTFFGMAVFNGLLVRERKIVVAILLIWASVVAYSRIYLGVHYPADIVGGAILGTFLAWLVYRFFINLSKNLSWIK